MEHRITVKIDDRLYHKTINSEEEEALVRKAVASLNETLVILGKRYSKASVIDLLTIAALNETIGRVELQQKSSGSQEEYETLASDLHTYVESLK